MWVECGADGIQGSNILAKAAWIADQLYAHVVLPDDGLRLRRTGSISPSTTLKTEDGKSAFAWACDVGGKRFFTRKACKMALERLLEMPGVTIPLVGGITRATWVEQQATILMHFSQRARKNSLAIGRGPRPPRKSSASSQARVINACDRCFSHVSPYKNTLEQEDDMESSASCASDS